MHILNLDLFIGLKIAFSFHVSCIKVAKAVIFCSSTFENNVSNFQEHSSITKRWVYILPASYT